MTYVRSREILKDQHHSGYVLLRQRRRVLGHYVGGRGTQNNDLRVFFGKFLNRFGLEELVILLKTVTSAW